MKSLNRRSTSAKMYRFLARLGVCQRCRVVKAEDGKVTCYTCGELQRRSSKAYRDRKKEEQRAN